MSGWVSVVLAVLALLGGGGGVYSMATVGATKRKMLADTEATKAGTVAVLGKAAVELLEPLRTRVRELETDVDQLRQRVRRLNEDLDTRDQRIGVLEATSSQYQSEIVRLQAEVLRLQRPA